MISGTDMQLESLAPNGNPWIELSVLKAYPLIYRSRGAFNNLAASLAASLDSSSSIERISRKARLAKMESVAKVF